MKKDLFMTPKGVVGGFTQGIFSLFVLAGIILLCGPLIVAFFVLISAYYAWVLTYLWAWFVVPLFGLPVLTLAQAFGLSLVIHYFHPTTDFRELTSKESKQLCLHYFAKPAVVLLFGWVVKTYWL